ncbi:MAG: ribosome recycling factor [Deltaproteobacteria bacterium]|nr:ribosome recycling factor [Deltaproteobacteria bacterium]
MENTIKTAQGQMEKTLGSLKQELVKIRTGRASLSILDDVKIDYYGVPTPLNQVATLNVPEPKMITIHPWEAKIIPEIEKGIQKAGIGLTPSNDGKIVRLPIPSLNEERRKELVKIIKKHAEECRVAMRMVRRDANDGLKEKEDGRQISEDDLKKGQDRVQKVTDEYMKKVDELVAHKEKDIMSV